MQTEFIKSCEQDTITDNGELYKGISIELYESFKTLTQKENEYETEIKLYKLFLLEPTAKDNQKLIKLSAQLNGLCDLFNKTQLNQVEELLRFDKDRLEEILSLHNKQSNEVVEKTDTKTAIFGLVNSIFNLVSSKDEYFNFIQSFIDFLQSKICYQTNTGLWLEKEGLNILNNTETHFFIKEDIIKVYLSFFFKLFPSRSFYEMTKI